MAGELLDLLQLDGHLRLRLPQGRGQVDGGERQMGWGECCAGAPRQSGPRFVRRTRPARSPPPRRSVHHGGRRPSRRAYAPHARSTVPPSAADASVLVGRARRAALRLVIRIRCDAGSPAPPTSRALATLAGRSWTWYSGANPMHLVHTSSSAGPPCTAREAPRVRLARDQCLPWALLTGSLGKAMI